MRRIAAALTVLALLAAGVAEARAPRSGRFDGSTGPKRRITLIVQGRSIDLAAFDFRCRSVTGRTSLNQIAIRRTSSGYRFSIRSAGSISFSDGRADENGRMELSGRFSSTGRSVRGRLRVRSTRCRDTGSVRWSARRRG